MISEKRQKLLMTSVLIVLLLVSAQLWMVLLNRQDHLTARLASSPLLQEDLNLVSTSRQSFAKPPTNEPVGYPARSALPPPSAQNTYDHDRSVAAFNQINVSTTDPNVLAHYNTANPSNSGVSPSHEELSYQLVSVALINGVWHARLQNQIHQVFDVSLNDEIIGLGKVIEINNQQVVFQGLRIKTQVGFSNFSQQMSNNNASPTSNSFENTH